jgi:DNA-binding NarL/FixJ family response regulator
MSAGVLVMSEMQSERLTTREYQIALLAARGLANKEIARELGVSDGTVKLHLHKVYQKLGVRNRYGLMIELGGIDAAE